MCQRKTSKHKSVYFKHRGHNKNFTSDSGARAPFRENRLESFTKQLYDDLEKAAQQRYKEPWADGFDNTASLEHCTVAARIRIIPRSRSFHFFMAPDAHGE